MIALEKQLDVQLLHKQGLPHSQIARRLGIDRRTVRRYIEHPESIKQPRKVAPRPSKVDAFRDTIATYLQQDPETPLAVSLAVKACYAGQTIFFTTVAELIEKLKGDHLAGKSGRGRSHYKSALVVVDEVGYTPIGREECHLFYRFVATRYEKASTIITSNKAFVDWAELFHDPVIVTAILDRLLHQSVVVNIKGHSYRLWGKVGTEHEPSDKSRL